MRSRKHSDAIKPSDSAHDEDELLRSSASESWQARLRIIQELSEGEIPSLQVAARLLILRAGLCDPNYLVRQAAAGELGTLGRRSDFSRLIPLLDDSSWIVRCSAVASISSLSPKRARRLLIRSATEDRNPHVRRYALFGLSRNLDAESLGFLLDRLETENSPLARFGAALALAQHNHKAGIDALISFIKFDEPPMINLVIEALSEDFEAGKKYSRSARAQILARLKELPIHKIAPYLQAMVQEMMLRFEKGTRGVAPRQKVT